MQMHVRIHVCVSRCSVEKGTTALCVMALIQRVQACMQVHVCIFSAEKETMCTLFESADAGREEDPGSRS